MTLPNSLTYMLIQHINNNLEQDMQTNIPVNDPTRANLVRPGLLQDDPTIARINVLTYANDPDDELGWLHGVIPGGTPNQTTQDPPSYQIGGGEMWYRRFKTMIEVFPSPKVDRQGALQLASVVLARAERTLTLLDMNIGTDDFGESAIDLRVMKSGLIFGGGEGQFIHICNIWYQILTEKEA